METLLRGLVVLAVLALLIIGVALWGTERITHNLATQRTADVRIEETRAEARIETTRTAEEAKTERFQSFALALVTISAVADDNAPLLLIDLILIAAAGYLIWERRHVRR